MDTSQTVRAFVDHFRERGHQLLPESSLVTPPGDPVLFTTAGMHPLTPYLEGRPHPLGSRLVGLQRCLRTTDLDEVGDATHLTVFRMLGSWSLRDYPGSQSLRWGHELLTDGFGIAADRLHATVFSGDREVGLDTASLHVWQELGVPVELTSDNWWFNGPVGPCGPDSEIFVWTGDDPPRGTPAGDQRWVEVWNHVMMRYHRQPDGSLRPLSDSPGDCSPGGCPPGDTVDTGMGLERLLMVLQGVPSVFDCDLFRPWTSTVTTLWDLDDVGLRIVCDHLRSAVVVLGDGVRPSTNGRGYVLRRLLRRALTTLWRGDPSRTMGELPLDPLDHTLRHHDQPAASRAVRELLLAEERRFRTLMTRGRRLVDKQLRGGPLTDDDLAYLHDTHGLPPELVTALVAELE